MQLLLNTGEEQGLREGLGIISGHVTALMPKDGVRIPHVGWNNLTSISPHPLFDGIKLQVDFILFTHIIVFLSIIQWYLLPVITEVISPWQLQCLM